MGVFVEVRCLDVYRETMCRIGDLLARPKLPGWLAYIVCVYESKLGYLFELSLSRSLSLLIKCCVECRVLPACALVSRWAAEVGTPCPVVP